MPENWKYVPGLVSLPVFCPFQISLIQLHIATHTYKSSPVVWPDEVCGEGDMILFSPRQHIYWRHILLPKESYSVWNCKFTPLSSCSRRECVWGGCGSGGGGYNWNRGRLFTSEVGPKNPPYRTGKSWVQQHTINMQWCLTPMFIDKDYHFFSHPQILLHL